MNLSLLMAAASGLVIGNSLFFGVYIWGLDNRNKQSNHLLALLLFALALRISKSVIIIMFPNSPEIFPAIGLTGMAAIGPFLYLYLQSIHQSSFTFDRKKFLHLMPSLLIVTSLPFVNEEVIYRFYQLVVMQIFIYMIYSFSLHRSYSSKNQPDRLKQKWGYILLSGTFLIWSAFFAQLIADTFILYLTATIIAAFVLYGISFWVMKNRLSFKKSGRLNKLNGDADAIAQKIRKIMENDKIYKDPDLTLDKFSDAVKSQSYLVSLVINEKFNMSFPELVNTYRIEEAKSRLKSREDQHLSVESIAYDSGFNSISSFYSSFKKLCYTTPADYRKEHTGS